MFAETIINMNVYEEIKKQCDELGISISSICKEAQVDRQLVERWKKGDPKSIEIYKKLKEVLTKKKQIQNA